MAAVAKTHEFTVGMTCGGCKNAVTRILSKIEGISSFEADVDSKKVFVTGTVDPQLVFEKLKVWADAAKKDLKYEGEKA